MNLLDSLDATVRRRPDHPALQWGSRSMTYRELREAADRAATVFVDNGVRPGDRVLVMTLNDPGFVVAMYGIWRVGAVLVPVNHKLQPEEISHIVRHSGGVFGVASDAVIDTARQGGPEITWMQTGWEEGDFDRAVAAAAPFIGGVAPDEDYAQVLYTSGTTSAPKGCVHTHRGISAVSPNIANTLHFTPDERFLMIMPIWHASPLNDWLLTTMYIGGTVVLMREFDAAEFLPTLEKERITSVFGAPIAYIAPVQKARAEGKDLRNFDLSSVEKLIYGAAPLGEDQARMLIDAYGTGNFYQVYGMTETGPAGSCLQPSEQLTKAGSIGKGGMFGVDLKVVDETGRDVDADGQGEIWMRADSVMSVYMSDPAATAEVFIDGWYRTGDVASVDADGYVYIVDRKKDVIITGGENVYSTEVEDAVMAIPSVRDVAVVGRQHPEWGETVVAVVVTLDGQHLSVDEVREHLAGRIAKYKIPREVIVARGLPRNPSGKLLKHVIRAEVNS
ncbi:AMP-binding protein [Corynebacterium sp. USCH3]|uniref:class I adenylate-forming enzyme family protein n=1 Tax=Corynebacterium sp. USCH3 TaxID=3024840 RepID=UPI0030A1ADEB